jgi:predicted RNA-binding protein YlqC (UPF0109 family)
VLKAEDLLQYLTKSLVSLPEEVEIDSEQDGDITVFRVKVSPVDMGRLIGRSGRTAKALRELVGKAAACNQEGRVQVVILE